MIGKRISHYEIEALLGEGAMGRVFRAKDVVLERSVALKLLAASTSSDPSFMERFLREARLAAQLNHPHIATIHEFGQDGNDAFLAMELVDGETLADVIARGPLPIADVRRWGAQAASALAAAHAQGIVHRDIKPGNLMITRQGVLKVMDFGIARRAGETAITAQGSLVGTPKTMAPEILRGQEPAPASDLFSLGCVLYEAVAGRSAFVGEDIMAVLYQVAQQDPTPLRQLRTDAPEDVVGVVEGLLVKDPARRFGPAEAVVVAFSGDPTQTSSRLVVEETLDVADAAARTNAAIAAERSQASRSVAFPPPPGVTGSVVPGTQVEVPVAVARRQISRRLLVLLSVVVLAAAGIWTVMQRRGTHEAAQARARELNDRGAVLAEQLNRMGAGHAPVESIAVARAALERAVALDRGYAVPWNNLGALSQLAGEWPRAEREFRKAVELDPGYATARLNLAATLEELGNRTASEREYRRAMQDDSTLVAAPNNLAYLLNAQGRSAEAIEVLRPALRRWPNVAALWKNYGLALEGQANLAEAERALLKSLELAPDQLAVVEALDRIVTKREQQIEKPGPGSGDRPPAPAPPAPLHPRPGKRSGGT